MIEKSASFQENDRCPVKQNLSHGLDILEELDNEDDPMHYDTQTLSVVRETPEQAHGSNQKSHQVSDAVLIDD